MQLIIFIFVITVINDDNDDVADARDELIVSSDDEDDNFQLGCYKFAHEFLDPNFLFIYLKCICNNYHRVIYNLYYVSFYSSLGAHY